MKIILLSITSILMTISLHAQITATQISDFQDGTTQGWSNGAASPNPPVNIPNGGPTGAGDNFLREVSSGGSGPGSRLVVFNDENEWQGNYTAANILSVSFHAKNFGTTNLSLRIAMEGGDDTSEMVTTQFVSLPASQTDWILITISILASDFTVTDGDNTPAEVLADMSDIRIISNPNAQYEGESIAGTLDLDNIRVNTVLATTDNDLLNALRLFPNPVSETLYLAGSTQVERYELYSLIGALLRTEAVQNNNAEIDFSLLPSGIYLVKVKSKNSVVIKQVIKH